MKVLIVRTFPNILNPKQYNIQEIGLAKALTKQGCQCGIVLYNGKNKDSIDKIPVTWDDNTGDITIYRLHGYNLLKNGIFPSLNQVAKQYDVIQVHEYDQLTSWLYYAWKRKPVIIYHGPFYSPFNKGYNFKCKIFDHIFLKMKSGKNIPCLTKSKSAATFLQQRGFQNVTPVGVGLDIDNMQNKQQEQEQEITVDRNKFTLLYVGKIEVRRNSLFLIELMKETKKRNLDIQYIIIGDGEKEYVENFLELLQPFLEIKMVYYYPFATQNMVAKLYQKVQALIFPTQYDIYGMVLLEAMYFNLPIISSPNGGTDMLVQNRVNGFVQEDFDVVKWMDIVQNLYHNHDMYQELRKKIETQDKKQLTWDYLAQIFIEKYQEATNHFC